MKLSVISEVVEGWRNRTRTEEEKFIWRLQKSLRRRGWLGTLGLGVWKIYFFFRERVLPSRRRARYLDRTFDARFGVDTGGIIELAGLEIDSGNKEFGQNYQAIPPTTFDELISELQIKYEDFLFIDFGSGKGRALLLASEFPFKKIIGVEFAHLLHERAQQNIHKYNSPTQKCRDLESVWMDATVFAIPRDKAVFYFFNPFGAEVMAIVLGNIKKSLEEYPREVFILYGVPDQKELLEKLGFLKISQTKYQVVYRSG